PGVPRGGPARPGVAPPHARAGPRVRRRRAAVRGRGARGGGCRRRGRAAALPHDVLQPHLRRRVLGRVLLVHLVRGARRRHRGVVPGERRPDAGERRDLPAPAAGPRWVAGPARLVRGPAGSRGGHRAAPRAPRPRLSRADGGGRDARDRTARTGRRGRGSRYGGGVTSTAPDPARAVPTAADEVVRICQELIRFDTSNYGTDEGPGERAAAEYVMELLHEVGLEPELFESRPGRASVVVRLEGQDPSRPALVLHGHLDVVPAAKDDWSVDPFGGEETDGLLWGRGAVDMKDMDAMILAVVRQMAREGRKPARDVVVAFFADEEAGGVHGARWAVDNRPDLFEGATEAIS